MTTWFFGALFGFGVGILVGVFVCWYQSKHHQVEDHD